MRPLAHLVVVALTAVALTAVVLGCGGRAPASAAPAPNAVATATAGTVALFVTTGDRAKLLHEEPTIAFTAPVDAVPTIVIDRAQRFQEIVGFGAALSDASAYLMQHRLAPEARERLLQSLFGRANGGAGFSFTRVDMGGSDFARAHYTYDDVAPGDRDPTLARFSVDADRDATIPLLRRAMAINPDLKLMASPWSAPAWMKTSGTLVKGSLAPEAYDAFARYFVQFVQAYEREGIPVFAISIQNEPHFEPDNYPGMRVEPPARAAFVGRHLGPAFRRAGIRTHILDWDHNWDQPESPLAVLADTLARQYVRGVAWHCYGGEVSAQSRVHDAHPDRDAYFTECSGGRWAPKFADNLAWNARTLIIGATRHWARGVLMWNLALDEAHGPHLGGCGDCRGVVTINTADGTVTPNEEFYAFAHASRWVLPGARRVASTAEAGGVENVAFANPDGTMAMVAVNTGGTAREVAVRDGARSFRATLPAGAVATFVWR